MRCMLIMTAAVLLVCCTYSHQEDVHNVDVEGSALSEDQLVRQAREADSDAALKRIQRQLKTLPNPDWTRDPYGRPPGEFDEIDHSGFPIGSKRNG